MVAAAESGVSSASPARSFLDKLELAAVIVCILLEVGIVTHFLVSQYGGDGRTSERVSAHVRDTKSQLAE